MEYIINQAPNMKIQPLTNDQIKELSYLESINKLSLNQLRQLLDTIAYETRAVLEKYCNIDITTEPLTGYCIKATNCICHGFGDGFDIEHYRVQNLFTRNMFHSFAVGHFQTVEGVKRYIIDLTYRQFCLTRKSEQQLGYDFIGAGHFFYNHNLLRQLLKDGYLEITRESLTAYANSFVLAGEALENYKEQQFDVIHRVPYNYEDYSEALETGKMLVK